MSRVGKPPLTLKRRLTHAWLRFLREWRIYRVNAQVAKHARLDPGHQPVAIFNASSRLSGFSQNAAFSLLTSWGLQLAGVPVRYFVCRAGMSRCVLGTNPDDHFASPPCDSCVAQSQRLFASVEVNWFEFQRDPELESAIEERGLEDLLDFQWPTDNSQMRIEGATIPFGELVLPSLRWALRRHKLSDDEPTRFLLREYIQSANRVAVEFDAFLDRVEPAAIVLFNGIMFPEAIARWVALRRGVRVITHEVGFRAFSAFFTQGQATAYPIHIPESFELSDEQIPA